MMYLLVLFLFTVSGMTTSADVQLQDEYLEALLERYGTDGIVSKESFYELSTKIGLDPSYVSDESITCNSTLDDTCIRRCLGYEDIYKTYNSASGLNNTTLSNSLSAIVYSVQDDHCHHVHMGDEEEAEENKPSSAEAWGLGIGSASVIVFISNIGVFFKPCMKSRGFQRIMYFCVALAVGTLGGTGLLVLIPESLHITGDDSPIPDYRWKLTTAIIGIYVFFVVERCINWRAKTKKESKEIDLSESESLQKNNVHDHSHVTKGDKGEVATVAWTLLLGDALHNFSDGLAMGAAYTESASLGVSVSLAILTEELPHELGDIAILLHSGMTIKRALFYNFIAAVTIYLGLIIGILVGVNTDANTYIFAFAGGLFVYIALADMIPEMNIQAKEAEFVGKDSTGVVFILQNLGLLIGFAIVIVIAVFGGNIVITF